MITYEVEQWNKSEHEPNYVTCGLFMKKSDAIKFMHQEALKDAVSTRSLTKISDLEWDTGWYLFSVIEREVIE